MELTISPEDIDRLVRETIMKSAFGDTITKAVNNALSGYNSPVDDAVKKLVGSVATDVIREKFDEEIRALVTAAIEKRVTQSMLESIVDAATERMARAVKDSY